MLKYYELRHTVESNIVGVDGKDQISELTVEYNREVLNKYQLLDRKDFAKELPPLDNFELAKMAKITDVLSNMFIQLKNGLFVNEKVNSILNNYSIYKCRRFNASIKSEDQVLEYYFYYIAEGYELVDYSKTKFSETDALGFSTGKQIGFKSSEEFYAKCKEIGALYLSHHQVYLFEMPDMFRLPWETFICVSEKLKNELEKSNVTGIEITESKMEFYKS